MPHVDGFGGGSWLSQRRSVELEQRITGQDQRVGPPLGNCCALALSQEDNGACRLDTFHVFGHAADHHEGVESGITEHAETCGRA